uniref:Uncharacterized protein n=1 Tax=Globisporangium ultimum (strain ATCC 200006 / CBS 805.95 / DAOM BR144) TaxID=431595 RepID=K3X4V2_GLOUD
PVLDALDVEVAIEEDLLRSSSILRTGDTTSIKYGIAYDSQHNIGTEIFASQKACRDRCKDFAPKCGFQIFVKQTSVKPNQSGNAKYACKKMNGMQFFDQDTPADQL